MLVTGIAHHFGRGNSSTGMNPGSQRLTRDLYLGYLIRCSTDRSVEVPGSEARLALDGGGRVLQRCTIPLRSRRDQRVCGDPLDRDLEQTSYPASGSRVRTSVFAPQMTTATRSAGVGW